MPRSVIIATTSTTMGMQASMATKTTRSSRPQDSNATRNICFFVDNMYDPPSGDQSRRPSTMLLKQMQLQQLQSARSFSAVSNAGEIEQPLLMSLMALLKVRLNGFVRLNCALLLQESEGTSASATCGHQRKAKRRPGAYNDRGGSRQSSSAESVPTWPIEGERRKSRAATAILPFLPHVPNSTCHKLVCCCC